MVLAAEPFASVSEREQLALQSSPRTNPVANFHRIVVPIPRSIRLNESMQFVGGELPSFSKPPTMTIAKQRCYGNSTSSRTTSKQGSRITLILWLAS